MKETTLLYYDLTDKNNFKEMLNLFSEDIIYIRNEKEIKGINNLKKFYLEERKLRGTHSIKKISKEGNKVSVEGIYTGTDDNKPIEIHFTDEFEFNKEGKISKRITRFI